MEEVSRIVNGLIGSGQVSPKSIEESE